MTTQLTPTSDTTPAGDTSTATDTTTAHQLDAVLRELAIVLDRIPTDRASDPTPCTEYDVATLRQHVLGWLTAFTDGYSSETGQCSDPEAVTVSNSAETDGSAEPDGRAETSGGAGADQVRALADRLATVLPDAAARPLRIGDSEMPGGMALSMILWEYQVHGWDLAVATGQAWQPKVDGVEASLAFAPGMLTPDYQGEGKTFAPAVEVPADASPLDQLVALTGRDPSWTATPADPVETTRTSGTFTVTSFEPQPYESPVTTGLPTGHVLMRKEFSGGITGWARTQFSYAFDEQTTTGSYVALESFTGSIDGRSGTCNLVHSAAARGTDERADEYFLIVPGSGTGELRGITGTGSIVVDPDGTHHLHLDHRIEAKEPA